MGSDFQGGLPCREEVTLGGEGPVGPQRFAKGPVVLFSLEMGHQRQDGQKGAPGARLLPWKGLPPSHTQGPPEAGPFHFPPGTANKHWGGLSLSVDFTHR